MENVLKIAVKDENFFITSQEKRINKIYKKLVDSNSMSEETRTHPLETIGSWTNFICFTNTNVQVTKYKVFSAYLRAINKYTVKESFNITTEIVEPDSSNFMDCIDIDSLFTNIHLEETIEICTNNLFKNNDIVHGLKKSEFLSSIFSNQRVVFYIF